MNPSLVTKATLLIRNNYVFPFNVKVHLNFEDMTYKPEVLIYGKLINEIKYKNSLNTTKKQVTFVFICHNNFFTQQQCSG